MNIKRIIVFISLFFFLLLLPASAADNPRVYFEAPVKQVAPGSEFTVKVLVDAGEPINAIDLDIGYSKEALQIISLNDGKSIIDFWRNGPQNSPFGNPINLQGGGINPFKGTGGEIISLNLRATKEGEARLTFGKANLYYADGKGTKAEAKLEAPVKISIVTGVKIETLASVETDKKAPVIETARVALAPVDKSRLAVFQATDDESGIKMTEIRFRRFLSWGDWQTAVNPVRLLGTVWTFQIKATDNAGNASEKTVYVPQAFLNLSIPVLALLTLIIAIGFRSRRNKAVPREK